MHTLFVVFKGSQKCIVLNGFDEQTNSKYHIILLYAESISAWSKQGSVMCLLSILNQYKMYGGNIYLSISLIIQLEFWILQSALSVNGNIYFYWNYSAYLLENNIKDLTII